ncbi:MAG: AMP-binding protein [Synechococcales cyanobacterium RM1_1_8]|nr:AMP-binding protein [Synechococcales cyanobacterium RM1_1_8]
MATALEWLNQRSAEDWIWSGDGGSNADLSARSLAAASQAAAAIAQQHFPQLSHSPEQGDRPPVILLATADPATFLAWFSALTSLGYPLFLGNPDWGEAQWRQIAAGLAPDVILADLDQSKAQGLGWTAWNQNVDIWASNNLSFPQISENCGKPTKTYHSEGRRRFDPLFDFSEPVEKGWICIPTGGSTGQLRFAIHSWKTLAASVGGLRRSPLVPPGGAIHSYCLLPLFHVSGLMQFLRSLLTGGQLVVQPWHQLLTGLEAAAPDQSNQSSQASEPSHPIAQLDPSDRPWTNFPFFLSLVPTQLQRLLNQPAAIPWLRQFHCIFLGGAPAWPALLDRARAAALPLAPTYGMTETASQVATLSPAEFLRGRSGCGPALPHARLALEPAGAIGPAPLRIRADSLALGYYSLPAPGPATAAVSGRAMVTRWDEAGFLTDDLGQLDGAGRLTIVGRASDKIISGGENIFPAAVEAAILATGLVVDGAVLGWPDPVWGERVVAVVVAEAMAVRAVTAGPVAVEPVAVEPAAVEPAAVEPAAVESVESAPGELVLALNRAIAPQLSPAQRPKQWLIAPALPRNGQGKLQRQPLRAWLQAVLERPA